MKLTVLVAVICLINIPETKAAPKLGLLMGLELPILGKINTNVNVGVDDHKGLLGLTKVFVKGLKAKATSALLKRILPKDSKPKIRLPPHLPGKDKKKVPK